VSVSPHVSRAALKDAIKSALLTVRELDALLRQVEHAKPIPPLCPFIVAALKEAGLD
jgi:hypothetical protein